MFKKAETNNIYPTLSPTLSNKQQFRLNRINEIKDYFVNDIKERELMAERLVNILLFSIILTSH